MLYDHFPYVLVKIGEIESTLGGKFVSPILYPDKTIMNSDLWEEFLKLNNHYTIRESEKTNQSSVFGEKIWGPAIGESFIIRSKISNGIRTSMVTDILSENIFTTMNSVYFIIDESWRKKTNRDQKIDKILKD